MEKITTEITTEFITLTNLLKYCGAAESGGQAHEFIEAGMVAVNGALATEKRKKIYAGDIVKIKGVAEITVSK